jgi:arylsulfatase A-like enzyme
VRFLAVLACALVLVTARTPSSSPQSPASKSNVLLITLDTTRADRIGFMGSARGLTPALDAFAQQATVFTRAYAQAPVTTVSHATILTGTFPPFHRVTDFGAPLSATVPYLPDLLHRSGYRTGAFVGSLVLDPRSGTAPGFERGFDRYDAGFRVRRPGEDRYQTLERRGDDVVARAQRWIADAGAGPWFAWVHVYDAHDPYDPPADLKRRFAAAPYDGEIAALDRAAGRLLQAAGDRTLVVVTADHGEALGEHGEETHGVFLYDEVLHVPLAIRRPDRAGAGVRVDTRVRLADVAPTMLEAVGIVRPAAMQGETLSSLVTSANARVRLKADTTADRAGPGVVSRFSRTVDAADRPAYAESDYPRHAFG